MEMSRMYLKIDGLRKDVKKDLTSSIPVKVNQKSIKVNLNFTCSELSLISPKLAKIT